MEDGERTMKAIYGLMFGINPMRLSVDHQFKLYGTALEGVMLKSFNEFMQEDSEESVAGQ